MTIEELKLHPIFYNSKLYSFDELKKYCESVIKDEKSLPPNGEPIGLLNLMLEHNVVKSLSEARRLVQGGAVYLDNIKITDFHIIVIPYTSLIVKYGKGKYFKIKIEKS